jgi:protoporphyrinogen oxidase
LSNTIIEHFFRPFFGGIFLDPTLTTSSRMCEFVFRMFSAGDAALPRHGMVEIPKQLEAKLPADTVRTNSSVVALENKAVVLASGERIEADAIVVATEAPGAGKLLGAGFPKRGQSVRCLYFAAPEPPLQDPMLVLNGDGRGPINNLCVPSNVSPDYAPRNKSLVSVTVLDASIPETELEKCVRSQLVEWYGKQVETWQHLKTYTIPYALPRNYPDSSKTVVRSGKLPNGMYVCGDYCETASINGAMVSGRVTAEAVVAQEYQNT